MQRRKRKLSIAGIAGLMALLVFLAGCDSLSESSSSDVHVGESASTSSASADESALADAQNGVVLQDARSYAEAVGVSLNEAVHRLMLTE